MKKRRALAFLHDGKRKRRRTGGHDAREREVVKFTEDGGWRPFYRLGGAQEEISRKMTTNRN